MAGSMVEELLDMFADDFISVKDGVVTRPSREASLSRRDGRWELAMVASTQR